MMKISLFQYASASDAATKASGSCYVTVLRGGAWRSARLATFVGERHKQCAQRRLTSGAERERVLRATGRCHTFHALNGCFCQFCRLFRLTASQSRR